MTQTTFTPFATVAEKVTEFKPRACIGFVESVGEPKVTQNGAYINQPITLSGAQSGSKAWINMLYRPDFLRPGFNPLELPAEKGNNQLAVYTRHIGGSRTDEKPGAAISTLAAIAGSMDSFYQLAGLIQSAIEGKSDEEVPVLVQQALQDYVNERSPEVGYVLYQKTEAQTGSDGKTEYVPAKGSQVGNFADNGWFFPSDQNDMTRLQKKAEAGKLQLAFELPF